MNRIFLLCCALLCSVPHLIVAQSPGVKATITARGLSYVMAAGVEVLESNLQNLAIPDVNGSQSVVGLQVQYWVSNIQIQQLSLPNDQLVINPSEEGLDVVIQDVSLDITADWKYREEIWPHISSSGTVDVSVSQSSVTLSFVLGETGGRISISSYNVALTLGDLKIDLHGGASWFLQLFEDVFNNKIKNAAEQAILSQASSAITTQLEPILASIPVIEQIDSLYELNYELVAPVELSSSNYLTIPDKGEFFAINNQTEAPYTPGTLPDIVSAYESNMLQIIVDQYVFETLSLSVLNSKVLERTIVDADLPASSPLRLNTTYFEDLIPPLYSNFPDKMMELYVHVPTTPFVNIVSDVGTTLKAEVEVAFIILPSNETAFVLDVVLSFTVLAEVVGTNLTGSLTYGSSSMSILTTNIGTFDVSALDEILDSAVTLGLIPLANKRLSTGFTLPSVDGITFTNATVVNYDGYLLVSTDVLYSS
eukprot:TRINITY_DN2126_c0_g1_i2.p1 TRINITY_DN2126_c0_g1~~TRINITY_DN2126_c0_g1_i2.p1  ORF type:complete len:480 (+),score=131.88 TRINITY_DN2126_c0_g1_i2:44-1483(+)